MRAYIIRRLLLAIPTVFLVTLIIFFTMRLIPGTAVDALVARLAEANVDVSAVRAEVMARLGLDQPMHIQYFRWVGVIPQEDGNISGLLQGDLGRSFIRPNTVIKEIALSWPITLQLGIMAFIIAQLIALPIGIFSALRQDTWGDYGGRSFAIFAIAIPNFWIALMVIVLPAMWWNYMRPIMHVGFTQDPIANLIEFLVPAAIMGMAMAGGTMRMTRTMMLEVLRQDYIRTAWAKGLKERVVTLRHALKNALIPVITMVGPQLGVMLGGSVIIETIFGLPGMGLLLIESIMYRDYPMVSGVVLMFGIWVMFINLAVDLSYGFLDPRVHYK